jgi:hyperpolarization activated cyclic nucleotide-gated potassium channel 1
LKFNSSLNNLLASLGINKAVGKLVTVIVSVVFVVHLIACIWYWLADFGGFQPDCWVVRMDLVEATIIYRYVSSAYWAVQTLCTVGYGDIPAVTLSEKVMAILWMIGGFALYSYTIGNF